MHALFGRGPLERQRNFESAPGQIKIAAALAAIHLCSKTTDFALAQRKRRPCLRKNAWFYFWSMILSENRFTLFRIML
jgi:hypothetical protein